MEGGSLGDSALEQISDCRRSTPGEWHGAAAGGALLGRLHFSQCSPPRAHAPEACSGIATAVVVD